LLEVQDFRQHLTEYPNSWQTTYREAKGNKLAVTVSGGRVVQNYPLVIQAETPEVTVAIKGGVGAVPIRFEGLAMDASHDFLRTVSLVCRLQRMPGLGIGILA
jgi:hypothetical protein